ncbi:hypothetical protein OAW68_07435 [Alphaproteobacteria bacterium]|nr:hypothetical protein [Alphaproteobacteria bacterium]
MKALEVDFRMVNWAQSQAPDNEIWQASYVLLTSIASNTSYRVKIAFMELKDFKLAVLGLGYVGLPVAVEFGKTLSVIGFDNNVKRINELKTGNDRTLETTQQKLRDAQYLSFTTNPEPLKADKIRALVKKKHIIYDLNYILPAQDSDLRL